MMTRTVPIKLPGAFTYMSNVIENGHIPGVLSGTELKGKAKQFGSSYRDYRNKVAAMLFPYDIVPRIVFDEERRRYVKVWTDTISEQRIQVKLG